MQGKRGLQKQKQQPNSSLLGTYFVSLFSVLLCIVMLFGTTFAWFSSVNTSVGNEIHSGILTVDMRHVTAKGAVSLAQQPDHPVFSPTQMWVPGMKQTETVEVINTGNVPVSYKLSFVTELVDADGTIQRAAVSGVESLFAVSVKQGSVSSGVGPLNRIIEENRLLAEEEKLNPGQSQTISISLEMGEPDEPSVIMGAKVPLYLKLEAFQYLVDTH